MPIRTVRRRRVVTPEPAPRPARTVWPALPAWGRAPWALLPLGCVLLGGATERGGQGLMLLALGTALVAAPPRASLGRGLHLVLGALVALALLAFLPAGWFHAPAWRGALTGDFGVLLPGTVTPQPWLTAESLVLLLAGLAWFYWTAAVRWSDDERRHAGTLFAGGTVALAVLCVGLYRAGVVPAGWHSPRGFGPFPNRNQTADFFAVCALPVLACARAAWRADYKPAALGWLLGWLAVSAAVFHCFSRAGILLLFATTGFYLVVETLHRTRHQPAGGFVRWRRLAMVGSLVLVVGSALLLFGGDTLARFQSGGHGAAEGNHLSDTLRQSIYLDTIRLVNASPWCGNGLNTFAQIFPAYRRLAVQNTLGVIHPESDWLWAAAELGWPGVAVLLAGVGLIVRRLRLPRHGHDRPLRVAAALGLVGFLAHSFVDVSAHRVGSVFAALFLLSLALPGRGAADGEERTGNSLPPTGGLILACRGLGAVFLGVGLLWLLASPGWVVVPGEQGVARRKVEASQLGTEREYPAATEALTRALTWAPLDWQAYYQRASVGVYAHRPPDDALLDFRRARFLEPVNPLLPLREARVWAVNGQSAPAISALLEACRREPAAAGRMIGSIYPLAAGDPAFVAQLGAAARRDPNLAVALLDTMGAAESADFVEEVRRADPDLRRLSSAQKTRFFRGWALRGDPRSLAEAMTAHPGWQPLGWRWWAEARARDGTPDALPGACEIAIRFAPEPEVPAAEPGPRPLADLRRAADRDGYEPESALPLSRAQTAAGDTVGALATLQKAAARPDSPPYFHFLAARTAGAAGQWTVAWTAWQGYLQATRANETQD